MRIQIRMDSVKIHGFGFGIRNNTRPFVCSQRQRALYPCRILPFFLLDLSNVHSRRDHRPWHLADTAQSLLLYWWCCIGLVSALLTSRVECIRSVQHSLARSTQNTVRFGLPRGTVLSRILFILYTTGFIDLMEKYGVIGIHPQLHADNTTCTCRAPVVLGLLTSSRPPCQLACNLSVWLYAGKSLSAEHC